MKGKYSMTTNTIPSALAGFTTALNTYEAARAALHRSHLAADSTCSTALSNEAVAAQAAVTSSSDLGLNALNGELALTALSFGVGTLSPEAAKAKVDSLDAALKAFEAARTALDKARAALETALDAERTRALELRAKLAGIAEPKKS